MTSSRSSGARVDVMVVGAGPVGLFAALRLLQQGLSVRIIDQQSAHGVHSFPVVLHSQTLRLLSEAGLSAALFWRGRPITRLAVYSEYERRAVLDFPELTGGMAGVLTLPQDILRQALTNELTRRGVEIEWNTRLAVLQQDPHSVWGRLSLEEPAQLLRSAKPESAAFECSFLIGADGYESSVREALGLRLIHDGTVRTFVFFDATTQRSGTEAQLALADEHVNSVYPVQGGQSRFSFQLARSLNKSPDASALNELLLARMPWYGAEIVSFDWGGVAEFRRALVNHFGVGRVWLAGEAAHLTEPLGVQSVNVGIDEANELALRIAGALSHSHAPAFGPHYEAKRRRQWEQLLALAELTQPGGRSPQWALQHMNRLLASLPAAGHDLDDLLAQLRLLPSASSSEP